jgi:hypothetical protein
MQDRAKEPVSIYDFYEQRSCQTIDLLLHLLYPLAMRIDAIRMLIVSLAPDRRWGLRSWPRGGRQEKVA